MLTFNLNLFGALDALYLFIGSIIYLFSINLPDLLLSAVKCLLMF